MPNNTIRAALFLRTLPLAIGFALAAAGGQAPPPASEPAATPPTREPAPNVPEADLTQLIADNTAFATDLFQALAKEAKAAGPERNLLYSPYSITLALAMTKAGARGETDEQMSAALHLRLPSERLHPALNALDQRVTAPPEGEKPDIPALRLHVVNRLWGQVGDPFQAAFVNLVIRWYGGGLNFLDFAARAEECRQIINDWVAEQTEQRIIDLLPPDSITSSTNLVLTNAIYFKGNWATAFKKDQTKPAEFHPLAGPAVQVPTMHLQETLGYWKGDGAEAVELPYAGRSAAMLLIVPEAGHYAEYEAVFKAATLEAIAKGLKGERVDLSLPKFTYSAASRLKSVLSSLGMPIAFTLRADFSGMNNQHNLLINDVYHKAFIFVDEVGTEAAAATAVGMMKTSLEPRSAVVLKIDRPFLFAIRDTRTGVLLFVGRVLDPR